MTSPALLDLSLDTPSIFGAFTAPAAAEAVTLAAVGITSRFLHADQGEPTRRERGHATMQVAGPNVSGFPPTGRASPLLGEEPLVARAAGVDGHVAIRGIHAVRAYSADPAHSAPYSVTCSGWRSGAKEAGRRGASAATASSSTTSPPRSPARVGTGTVHHVAFAIRDGDEQRWRDRVAAAQLRLTPVMDRKANKSVYFREPSRVLFELATDQPGFVFEPADSLGESLMLAGDLENRRAELEQPFLPLANPRAGTVDRGGYVLTRPINARHGRNQGGKR
jgi:glyoxalase family protein